MLACAIWIFTIQMLLAHKLAPTIVGANLLTFGRFFPSRALRGSSMMMELRHGHTQSYIAKFLQNREH